MPPLLLLSISHCLPIFLSLYLSLSLSLCLTIYLCLYISLTISLSITLHHSVNQTIWGASAVCSVVFVTFGLLAATVFERPGANVLVVLSSLKMHSLTRYSTSLISYLSMVHLIDFILGLGLELLIYSYSPPHRFCAAFFGVAIIGCGAPIFCVIVKTSLYASRTCNGRWAFFIGAVLPYCVSWMMYQVETTL